MNASPSLSVPFLRPFNTLEPLSPAAGPAAILSLLAVLLTAAGAPRKEPPLVAAEVTGAPLARNDPAEFLGELGPVSSLLASFSAEVIFAGVAVAVAAADSSACAFTGVVSTRLAAAGATGATTGAAVAAEAADGVGGLRTAKEFLVSSWDSRKESEASSLENMSPPPELLLGARDTVGL